MHERSGITLLSSWIKKSEYSVELLMTEGLSVDKIIGKIFNIDPGF